jgi:FkbH-like protein
MSSLRAFLAYAGYRPELVLSEYDDSLSRPPAAVADVHVVWLDMSRYGTGDGGTVARWLAERVAQLRSALSGPILVVDAGPFVSSLAGFNEAVREAIQGLPDVYVVPLSDIVHGGSDSLVEERALSTGTSVPAWAALNICQHLGLRWIPALMRPRLKAVVLDLDNTLVGGVLAEDGVSKMQTDGPYARLQAQLLRLHREGVLLALVSKNHPTDVEQLFAERSELRPLHQALVAVEAGWGEKASSVRTIAARLRINTDSILTVDDNPGEVAAMASELPGARFLWARTPDATAAALALYPGLLSLRHDGSAAHRAADLVAAARRGEGMQSASDSVSYVVSLDIHVRLAVGQSADRSRLSDLSRKTNQFNTTLVRFSERDVQAYLDNPDRRVVTIRLRDRLSDSGLIGAVFARRHQDTAIIDEIAISCRALGRSLEPAMLGAALGGVAERLQTRILRIPIADGPRNHPARAWLAELGEPVEPGEGVLLAIDALSHRIPHLPVDIRWEDGGG